MLPRSLAAASLACLCAAALAAPVPRGRATNPLYFPTAVGAKWVYETPDGTLETAVVSEVARDGDDLVVSRKGADGTRVEYTKTVVSAGGLRQEREFAGGKLGWLLKTKLKSGESWIMPEGGKRTVTGPEWVEVPAGKFKALRVEWRQNGSTLVSWYAPDVGEVKRVRKEAGGDAVVRTLRSFKPPG